MGAFDEFDKEFADKAPAAKDVNPFAEFDAEFAPKPEKGIVAKATDAVKAGLDYLSEKDKAFTKEEQASIDQAFAKNDSVVGNSPATGKTGFNYDNVEKTLPSLKAERVTSERMGRMRNDIDNGASPEDAAINAIQAKEANAQRENEQFKADAEKSAFAISKAAELKDKPKRSLGDAYGDVGNTMLKVSPTAVKGVVDLANMLTLDTVDFGISKYLERGLKGMDQTFGSDALNYEKQEYADIANNPNADFGTGVQFFLKNPMYLTDAAGTSLGSAVLPAGVAGAVIKVATKIKPSLTVKAAQQLTAGSVASTIALQNAAETFHDEDIAKLPLEKRYEAAAMTALGTLAANKAFGGGLDKAISDAFGKTGTKQGIALALKEGGQEAGESLSQSNAKEYATPDKMTLNQALNNAASEGLLGAVAGGGFALANTGGNQNAEPKTRAELIREEIRARKAQNQPTADLNVPTDTNAPTQSNNITDEDLLAAMQDEAPDAPTPEPQETIQAQVTALNEGRKPAILLTPGESMPEGLPNDIKTVDIPNRGTLLYRDDQVLEQVKNGDLGGALGYGINEKPTNATEVITARDANGTVIQDVATDGSPEVLQAAQQVAGDTGTVEQRPIESAMEERQAATDPVMMQFNQSLEALNALMSSGNALTPIKTALGYDVAFDFQKAVKDAQNTQLPLAQRMQAIQTTRDISMALKDKAGNVSNQSDAATSMIAAAPTSSEQGSVASGTGSDGNGALNRPFAQATDDFLPKMRTMTTDAKVIGQIDEELKYRGLLNEATAHEAATSPTNDLPEPTEAQKEAGNYKKGLIKISGLTLSVENPHESIRKGVDKDGTAWENKQTGHYGYVKGVVARAPDKEHVDVNVKPGTAEDYAGDVYVINQNHPDTGKFDEPKVYIGYTSQAEAKNAYQMNYAKGWNGFGSMAQVPMERFKEMLNDKKSFLKPIQQSAPFAEREQAKDENVSPIIKEVRAKKNADLLKAAKESGKLEIVSVTDKPKSKNPSTLEELKDLRLELINKLNAQGAVSDARLADRIAQLDRAIADAEKPTDKLIGKNDIGQELFEKPDGVRYYKENGFKINEAVRLAPDGSYLPSRNRDSFLTDEERTAKNPVDTEKAKAQADLDSALSDLGDIFGANFKANITPEQEQKLIPVITRVLDAAFRLGKHSFKEAAKFALDTIRAKIGDDVADQITLDHLQGGYIAMSGKYGDKATSKKEVIAGFDSLDDVLNVDDFSVPKDMQEIIEARKNDKPTIEINTPERMQERLEIKRKLYGNGARNKNKRIDVVIGLPASGKSFALADPLVKEYGSLLIDSDEVKKELKEFDNGHGAATVHQESAIINADILRMAINNGDNIVYPTVGKTYENLVKVAQAAKDKGYSVNFHLVDVPVKTAFNQAIARFRETNRLVDPNNIVAAGLTPSINFDKLQAYNIGDTHAKYSNDIQAGGLRLLKSTESQRSGRVGLGEYPNQYAEQNVQGSSGRASSASQERLENATTLQTENVPDTGATSDNEAQQPRGGNSKPLAARVASKGGKTAGRESVRGLFDEPGTDGEQGVSGTDGDGPSSAAREDANAGNQSGTSGDLGNYEITDADNLGKGGLSQKYRDNVTAIKIIKTLESEQRQATPDERKLLAKYAGFGALQGVFDRATKQWSKEYAELKELLNDAEYRAANASVLNAYYTSPVLVKSMYAGLERLGFKGGRVLEPSLGSGNFFGMMPASLRNKSNLNGVELDVLTSKLAKYLYPQAKIATATGFQDYQAPNGYFDMVISNPPFGSEPLRDMDKTDYSGFSIHNYFIAKSIDKLREGGVMAVVVSNAFMDVNNSKAREWVSKHANLLGAVRLPNDAFKENAGTEVVTDILYFQKTSNPTPSPRWVNTQTTNVVNEKTGESVEVSVNNYFLDNKDDVLGRPVAAVTNHGNVYTVQSNGNVAKQLEAFNATLPQGVYKEPIERIEVLDSADNVVPDGVKVGTFYKDGTVIRQRITDMLGERRSIVWEAPNATAQERMSAMMDLRDIMRMQMRIERDPMIDTKSIEKNRVELNNRYDAFVKKFGYLNSVTNRKLFNDDTESSLLQGLESNYDAGISKAKALTTGFEEKPASAGKMPIMSRRLFFPPSDLIVVSNAKDALLASLNDRGRVDMDYMLERYSKTETEIVDELGDVLFTDPNHGYVTRDEYLSGDVKTKLVEAEAAAATNKAFKRNVEELKKIIPADKMPSEIYASAGVNWIPHNIYAEFAAMITGASPQDFDFAYVNGAATWVSNMTGTGEAGRMVSDYGTNKINAFKLIQLLINGKAPDIKKPGINSGGKEVPVTDVEATDAANAKLLKIKQAWDSWIWADPDRATQLSTIFNDKHNRVVKRVHNGSHMTFPGMVPSIGDKPVTEQGVLLPHQKNAVWRGIQDRNVLLDHAVGAGKTFVMAAIGMEMKRLGIARKPVYVVPNHLTLQWRSEFNLLYPGANVLAATPEDFAADKRERLFAKMVTGEYDAIIIGHSSLTKIGLPEEVEKRLYQDQADEIANAIEEIKRDRGDRGVVRDMEKIKKGIDDKIADLIAKAGERDKMVTFDELGIDALFVDEMHEFKNLFFTTQMQRTAGLGNPKGSGKAFDLFMKIKWMQETYGENAPLITATGTPVSNSLAEMFTMQRYMKFAQLKRDGFHLFDAWAKQFAEVENVYEVAPSGVGYRQSTRFTKFKNVPSLMGSYTSFADVITLDNLKEQGLSRGEVFPVPKMISGGQVNIVAERSPLQEEYFGTPQLAVDKQTKEIQFEVNAKDATIEQNDEGKFVLKTPNSGKAYDTKEEAELELVTQALTPKTYIDPDTLLGKFANLKELTKKSEGKINALSLTGLANKAGLDYRIIDPMAPDFAGSKINLAVSNMVDQYNKWTKDKGTQLIFCDSSIPLSARVGMANKEKRVYVRDRDNQLTHKTKGVVFAPEGYEGYPFFLVKEKDGFDVYEAVSGKQASYSRFADKANAKQWIDAQISTERGRDNVMKMRDQFTIEQDDINEYRDSKDIQAEDDFSDEVTLTDLEAVAGSAQFSVYDDIKTKLMAQGVPEIEIAFIHDYNTPKAKETLFKRVNNGEVRFLLGSTAKLGAGTNVQQRLVGLHHIDAPWRPSDLEQREGRIIRQGNKLYQRDPEGFEVGVWRYATKQTYDTRRWQLLEHKAAGIETLRNYNGEAEIDDIAGEAANSADMKAAASGNPLILEETKLNTEVKRLQSLERSHADSKFSMARKISQNKASINEYYPSRITAYQERIDTTEKFPIPEDKKRVANISVDGDKNTNKEAAESAITKLAIKVRTSANKDESRSIIYRGIEFTLDRGMAYNEVRLNSPDGSMHYYGEKESVSASGLIIRMNNYIDSFPAKVEQYKAWIESSKEENASLEPRLNEPFAEAELLKATQERHTKVQRKLAKSNQLEAVPANQIDSFKKLLEARKAELKESGYADALGKFDAVDEEDVPMFSRNDPFFSLGTGSILSLEKSKAQFGAKMLNRALVKYFDDTWSDSYESVNVPDTLSQFREEIKVAFGKELRYVRPTEEKFNIFGGVQIPKSPNAIYVNARSNSNLTTIAGHELYHALERSRPDLHKWFRKQAVQYIQNFGTYRQNLNSKLAKGEKLYKSEVALSELLADFTGDALSDRKFLQELANADGNKFVGLLNVTIKFLNEAITKLKNLGSSQYIKDVEALRSQLKKALVAFANDTEITDDVVTPQTETPQFKAWFGNSKVVDADGKPLVVYHGTKSDITAFSPTKGNGLLGDGIYTTADRKQASETYAGATSGSNVMPLYVSIQNPLVTEVGYDVPLNWQELGYDGVIYNKNNEPAWFVAANANQVKSAIGNNGDFDPTNPDIRFSREPQTRSEKIKAELLARKEKLSGARFDNNAHIPMGSLLNVFDRNQIVQLYSKDLPELLTYKAEQEAIVADRNALLYKADTFLDKLRAIPLEARDAIANIAHEATIEGVDPSKDYTDAPVVKDLRKVIAKFADTQKEHGLTEKQLSLLAKANDRVKALEATHARLSKAFKALNPKHQQIFKDLRDEYSASAKRVFDAFEDRIKRLQTSEEAKLGAITELRKQYDQVKQGIYFPLARFGDHVVIGNKMVDGIPAKVVEYYESKGAADQAGIRMKSDGYEVKITKRKEAIADNQSNKVLADVISKLKDLKSDSLDEKTANALREVIGDSISDMAIGKKARAIANGKASVSSKEIKSMIADIAKDIKSDEALGAEIKALSEKKVKPLNYAKELDSLLDDVNQAIIQMLPDQSYRRHFTHRKNTKGYSADFIRAYADSSWHAASHISTLRHGDIVTKSIEDMQARIDSSVGDTSALQDVVNHLIKREEKLREPTNQTVAFIGQMGFLSALASISNFFVNLTQTPMLTLPFLGARYGYAKAAATMTKALGTQVKAYAKAENLTDLKHALDIRNTISPAESALMTKLIDMGKIDLTQAHDLIDAANKNAPRPNGKWDLAMRVAAFPQHASEVINRQVSALAAISMELAKSGNQEKALDAAIQAIDQTHYDYEKSNRAMIMHGNTQRVLFMFKQYAQKTAYLWARTAYLAIGGAQASKQEKSVARKQLAGMLATQFALSGLLGLPIFLEAGAVAAGMTGFKIAGEKGAYSGVALVIIAAMAQAMDDDDPDEFDANVRQWLSEQVGKDAGEVLARGAFRLTGVDIAGRVNADELFVRKPDKTLEGKDARLAWMDSLLGYAIGGQANSVITGVSLMQEGHIYRGLEKIMPVKALRDLMQANRFANEGVKSLNGNPIVEKLDYSELMIKAAGFQPQRVAEQYEKNAAVRGSETLLNRQRKDLVTRYVNAEPQDRAEIRAKINEFNRNNPGYMIKPTNLVQSMLSKNKAKRDTVDGIRLPRKHQGTRERGDFANVD